MSKINWNENINNSPAKKEMSKRGCYKNMQWKTGNLQAEKGKERWCMTTLVHGEK